MKLETLLANIVHYCDIPDDKGASHLPVYNTATFDLKRQSGEGKIYDYSRSDNPTRNGVENIFTKAEYGAGCTCTNTGISALALLFDATLRSGDLVLVEKDCYGGTFRLLNVLKEKNNIRTRYTDFRDLREVEKTISGENFRLILCESPTKSIEGYQGRVRTISENTKQLITYFEQSSAVSQVYSVLHPDSYQNFTKIRKHQDALPGLISVVFNKDLACYYDKLNIPKGPSLGTEFTLAMPYVYLAHYDLVKTEKGREILKKSGLEPELLRISVGIEPVKDIIQVFEAAGI
ncbi:MAG: PLP-dependent transferase [Bacteroidota bacterium]